ncbi:hypothetical protein AB0K60_07875 [Thermopolyspora sp. NPDC052614]|uniref:hypothetical protein n=1 Tax=Thermopolyspora sp. NPDC052614 TaxID=3155682 RepID=UPI003433FF47
MPSQATAIEADIRPRRGRHLIEVARPHHLQRDHEAVLGTLKLAEQTAPETIRYNGYARRMTLEAELPATRTQAATRRQNRAPDLTANQRTLLYP